MKPTKIKDQRHRIHHDKKKLIFFNNSKEIYKKSRGKTKRWETLNNYWRDFKTIKELIEAVMKRDSGFVLSANILQRYIDEIAEDVEKELWHLSVGRYYKFFYPAWINFCHFRYSLDLCEILYQAQAQIIDNFLFTSYLEHGTNKLMILLMIRRNFKKLKRTVTGTNNELQRIAATDDLLPSLRKSFLTCTLFTYIPLKQKKKKPWQINDIILYWCCILISNPAKLSK